MDYVYIYILRKLFIQKNKIILVVHLCLFICTRYELMTFPCVFADLDGFIGIATLARAIFGPITN